MSGFVYLWFDKKHKRFYIGSHWGTEDDGYICSSTNMRNNYKNRSKDFKRRILSHITTNREDLLKEEQRWLDMIKPGEFGFRYYNINAKVATYLWWMNEETTKIVRANISAALKDLPRQPHSEATKKKIAKKLKGNKNGEGPMSEERRKHLQEVNWSKPRTEAQIAATKENQKLGAAASPITKPGWIPKHRIGTKHTPETIQKMSLARLNYYKTASTSQLNKHAKAISQGKFNK